MKTIEEIALEEANALTDELGVPRCLHDEIEVFEKFATRFLAAVDAERGKEAKPFEMDWPDYHARAMWCGLEDRNITNRYDAMQYGWDQAIERCTERLTEELFLSPTIPEGMALVPIEPTREIILAMYKVMVGSPSLHWEPIMYNAILKTAGVTK